VARIEKTVFISYRRKDISWALAVYQDLTHQGYDVFFDYTSIPSGDFEQIIISNIKARAHFVLILTPTTLDRCSESGDWLRREIENAIDEKRNIIPLFFDGFSFGSPNISEKLTGKLKNISRYNGMNVHHDYFLEAMERLRTKFLNVPLDAILLPVSTEVQEVVKEEKLAANKALSQGTGTQGALYKLIESVQSGKAPPVSPALASLLASGVSKSQLFQKSQAKSLTNENKIIFSNGMEFIRVPAGKFIMGSDNGEDDEKPQHTVDIPYDYWMGCYPVTNEQYNVYIQAKGIAHPVSGWENKKYHPVVNVSWNTVMEYCKWLNSLLKAELFSGMIARLPTEAEWEKSARGTDGREYPWGSKFYKDICNSYAGGRNQTMPVGFYSPNGDSPYGCADMAGNVWEWTHSKYKDYPYDVTGGRENEKADTRRIVRGGAYDSIDWELRCSHRKLYYPHTEWNGQGFRIVVSAAPP
jgi:formylglycine-generating enzyme required for sulfatase activity